jgi:predicted transcriptional regulator
VDNNTKNNAGQDTDNEEEKVYTSEELFRRLPISLSELARRSKISEVTAAKIRDGKTARLHTINKMLAQLSEVYGVTLTIDNTVGFNVLIGRYGDGKLEGVSKKDVTKSGSMEPAA